MQEMSTEIVWGPDKPARRSWQLRAQLTSLAEAAADRRACSHGD
jgi:hypothetical protein